MVKRYNTFYVVASIWRGGTTNDAPVTLVESALSFQCWYLQYHGNFLVHDYCRRIKRTYNFLTISCVPNWGIDSLSVDGNRIALNADRIIK